MALNITVNGQALSSGAHSIINLKKGFNKIIYNFTTANTDVVPGGSGTTYLVSVKSPLSDTWTMLETYPGSAVQVGGTLAAPGADVSGRIEIGTGAVPLEANLMYRLELTNDNAAGDTDISLYPQISTIANSQDTVFSDTGHQLITQNTNVSNWSFTGYPDIASAGVTEVDLSVADPNFPSNEMKYAIVHYVLGVTSNGSNAADVEANLIVGAIAENGTDIDVDRTWFANLKGRASEQNDSEDQGIYFIKMTDDNKIVYGLNTVEEAGSNAFGTVTVVGYSK